MSPAALANAGPAPRAANPKSIEQLVKEGGPVLAAVHETPEQIVQKIQEAAKKAGEHQTVVHRVMGTIASVSATASAGYLIWIARGGSLLLSMITSAPIWRFLDPLPVLNAKPVNTKKRRWWQKKKSTENIPDEGDEKLEKLMD
jgi:hypothetical protein